jgi:hypothetical protein
MAFIDAPFLEDKARVNAWALFFVQRADKRGQAGAKGKARNNGNVKKQPNQGKAVREKHCGTRVEGEEQ